MNLILAIQLLVCLFSFFAAVIVTFRPQRFNTLISLFARTRIKRIVQATCFWISLIVMIVGIAIPFMTFFAASLLFATSIPLTIRSLHQSYFRIMAMPGILIAGSVLMAFAQPLGLKVLALPKADKLPFNPVQWRIIKTYDEGLSFEGIAAGEDGTLYLSGNRGLDFSKSEYYIHAQGELIERKTNGNERVLFTTPKGFTAGVPVVASDKSIYLTSHGKSSCIWHIDSTGKSSIIAQLQNGAWPNGLDFGPDGKLYSPDSNLGLIWRIDPYNGKAEIALSDKALKSRPFISLAPGANGLHFIGRDLIVTVSDRTTVLQYSMDNKGKFGLGKVLAKGIPGDDFAIADDGSLYITTHPYNTIVHISPSGNRTIIGKEEQHIVGATDAVFGRSEHDKNMLYVVTDGGAFTGGPKMRGELILLDLNSKL